MNLTIDLPDDLGAALKAKALAEGISLAGFVEEAVKQRLAGDKVTLEISPYDLRRERTPKKSGYGLLAKYGPGPSEEEIDENRREMFHGFAQDVP